MLESKRWQGLSRDHLHLQQEEEALKKQQQQVAGLQSRPVHLRNKGGPDYDILNFQYKKDACGRALALRVRIC